MEDLEQFRFIAERVSGGPVEPSEQRGELPDQRLFEQIGWAARLKRDVLFLQKGHQPLALAVCGRR